MSIKLLTPSGLRKSILDNSEEIIYYNLKLDNIYEDDESSIPFQILDQASIILPKQSDYKIALESFALELDIPFTIFPIREGFISYSPIMTATAITKANPALITTSVNHGLSINDSVKIINAVGMTQINGTFFVASVPALNQLTIKSLYEGSAIDSLNFGTYSAGTAEILKLNDNINLSQMGICLQHIASGNSYPEPIIYIPDKDITIDPGIVPKPPSRNNGVQDNSTFYYYTYSINNIVKAINNALATATTRLNVDHPATLTDAPLLVYDESTRLFYFIVDFALEATVRLFANGIFINLFQGFRTEFKEFNEPEFKDFLFIVDNPLNTNAYVKNGGNASYGGNPAYLRIQQEWSSLYRFNTIRSIILVTNHIKIRSEWFPSVDNPNKVIFSNSGIIKTNNTGSRKILSSFDLEDSSDTVSWRTILHYVPDQYKWIDLISDEPLSKVDCTIYFETITGEFIQAEIPINGSNIIRFMFQKN